MDRIGTIRGEMNASIIRGMLEAQGIKANIAPDGVHLSSGASQGASQPHSVYVERERVQDALALLREHNFLPKESSENTA